MQATAKKQPNRRMVELATFHGRAYERIVSVLCNQLRRLSHTERSALFGVLADEWCIQCGHEHPHCKCPPAT